MATGDGSLVNSMLLALETGNVTPLVKEELRCTVQSRRLNNGLCEMEVDFPAETKHELREEEQQKIVKRREQNRLAARRFRDRRKLNSVSSSDKIKDLEEKVAKLRKEKADLQRLLYEHTLICPAIQRQEF